MGFSLKNTLNAGKGLLFGNAPSNAYTAPNVDFLRESAPSVNYDFLRAPTSDSAGFSRYMGAINAPSSVDEVRSGMNQEQLGLLLGDIERDTKQKFGSDISSYFGRGLIDPGRGATSDIASVGLAQTAAEGARTAANARLGYSLQDLERQASREKEGRDAYGAAFGYDQENLGRLATGEASNADREAERRAELARVLSGQASASASNAKPRDYGLLGTFGNSYASGIGKKLSGG